MNDMAEHTLRQELIETQSQLTKSEAEVEKLEQYRPIYIQMRNDALKRTFELQELREKLNELVETEKWCQQRIVKLEIDLIKERQQDAQGLREKLGVAISTLKNVRADIKEHDEAPYQCESTDGHDAIQRAGDEVSYALANIEVDKQPRPGPLMPICGACGTHYLSGAMCPKCFK